MPTANLERIFPIRERYLSSNGVGTDHVKRNTPDMRLLVTSLLVIAIGSCTRSIDTRKCGRFERVYHDGVLVAIREFDAQDSISFTLSNDFQGESWPNRYITTVYGTTVDSSGQRINIQGHSNVGWNIFTSEMEGDSLTRYFVIDNGFDDDSSKVNQNQFDYMRNISSAEDLINHPQILQMTSTGKRRLIKIARRREDRQVSEISFSSSGDTSSVTSFFYERVGYRSRTQETNGHVVDVTYDSSGRRTYTRRTYSPRENSLSGDVKTESWSHVYGSDGNLLSTMVSRNGNMTTLERFDYDGGTLVTTSYFLNRSNRYQLYYQEVNTALSDGSVKRLIKKPESNNEKQIHVVTETQIKECA